MTQQRLCDSGPDPSPPGGWGEVDFHVPQGPPAQPSAKYKAPLWLSSWLCRGTVPEGYPAPPLLGDRICPTPWDSALWKKGFIQMICKVCSDHGHFLQFCEACGGRMPIDDHLIYYPCWLNYYLSLKHRGNNICPSFPSPDVSLALILALDSHIITWIFCTTVWEKKIK